MAEVPAVPRVAADASVDVLRLARMHAMAAAILVELRGGDLDERARLRAERLSGAALTTVGAAVTPAMLEELQRLFRSSDRAPTVDELRVVWAQLLGWVTGIALGSDLDAVESVEVDG